jgi:hypothetical protein
VVVVVAVVVVAAVVVPAVVVAAVVVPVVVDPTVVGLTVVVLVVDGPEVVIPAVVVPVVVVAPVVVPEVAAPVVVVPVVVVPVVVVPVVVVPVVVVPLVLVVVWVMDGGFSNSTVAEPVVDVDEASTIVTELGPIAPASAGAPLASAPPTVGVQKAASSMSTILTMSETAVVPWSIRPSLLTLPLPLRHRISACSFPRGKRRTQRRTIPVLRRSSGTTI